MGRSFTLELSDGGVAETGSSIEEVAAKFLREVAPKPRPPISDEECDADDQRLSHETVSLGYAAGADNQGIDADLARAYADSHRVSAAFCREGRRTTWRRNQ